MRTARDDLRLPLAGSIATLMTSPFGSRIRLAPDFETGSPSARDREVFEIEHEFDLDTASPPAPRAGQEPPVVVAEEDEPGDMPAPGGAGGNAGGGDDEPGDGESGDGALDATPGDAVGADGEPKRGKKLTVQERINQLTKARREAEARAQQAEERARQQAEQLAHLQRGYEQTADVAATNFEVNLKARQSEAEQKYKAAYEAGDADALLEAQKALIDLKAEFYRLDSWKASRQQQAQRPPAPQQTAPQPVAQPQPPRPSERAERWMQENNWFGQDRAMTNEARAVHGDLLAEGYHPETDDYYEELTRRVRETFPHKFQAPQRQPAPASRGPATVVAPASRAVPAGNNRRVTLTPSQVETARKLGVPLEAYAAEVLKLSGR